MRQNKQFLLRRRLIVRPDLKQISVGLSLALSLVSGAVAAVTALPRALMTKVEVGNGTEEEEEDVMSMCFEVSSNSNIHLNVKSCALSTYLRVRLDGKHTLISSLCIVKEIL